jgi:hypothetical protein
MFGECFFETEAQEFPKQLPICGKTAVRLDTTGAKNPNNEDSYVNKKAQHVTVNMTIRAMDSNGVESVLRDHGHKFARVVHQHFKDAMSESSVV